ncbi:MAG: polysaccharide biosynthesis/export family protein [Desulfobacteraceae bacterium]|jgi:polysaccharide export outer membrane protein
MKEKKRIKLIIFVLYMITACSIIDFQIPQRTIAAELEQDIINIVDLKNNYKIGIGDVLDIVTWKEADFSRDNIVVRLDGKISFPLLDEIVAAGLTPLQLKKHISSLLKKFIDSPNVTVVVRSPVSQRFYVLGEVVRTGEYPIQKELTIIQAFAMAGGFTEWATKKEIILIRKKLDGGTDVIKVDYKKLSQGKGLENNIILKADDTIIVP